MIYYCVNAEFYDYGKVKGFITSKQSNEKPKNQLRQVYGMTAFKLWFESIEEAGALLDKMNDKNAVDYFFTLYEESLSERKAA